MNAKRRHRRRRRREKAHANAVARWERVITVARRGREIRWSTINGEPFASGKATTMRASGVYTIECVMTMSGAPL
jgi:hypothetical protein